MTKLQTLAAICVASSLLLTPTVSHATADDPYALTIIKTGDLELSCTALVEEASLMRDIIQTTEDKKNDAKFNGHAVTAAGAIGSFLVGSITGGIGLAAAGFFASQEMDETADTADTIQDVASQRRALISGIHKAKNCDTDITHAMADAESKSMQDIGAERLASLEPAAGDTQSAPLRLND